MADHKLGNIQPASFFVDECEKKLLELYRKRYRPNGPMNKLFLTFGSGKISQISLKSRKYSRHVLVCLESRPWKFALLLTRSRSCAQMNWQKCGCKHFGNHVSFCCNCPKVLWKYRKTSNISGTLVGNKIVDHSDVVGASPWHLASRDSAKKAARQYENLLSVGIWCVLY